MVDANTVWASLEQNVDGGIFNPVNKVVRTLDGGKTWTTHTISNDPGDYISCIFARGAQELWLTTVNFSSGASKIIATHNGGQSFEQKGLNAFAGPGHFPDVIHFFDAQHGFAMGDPVGGEFQVFTTADGGNTWVQMPADEMPDPLPGEYGLQEGYGAWGDLAVLGTSNNRVLRTADRGQSWQAIELPALPANIPSALVMGAAFSDNLNGLLVYNVNSGAVFQLRTPTCWPNKILLPVKRRPRLTWAVSPRACTG